jgi:hypothetical protein
MDQQTLINVAFGTIAAGIGWIIKSIYDAMKSLEKEVHIDYVRKDDYKDDIHEIKEMLGAIWKKLDSKADK